MKKQNMVIVGVIALVLALAVGYALFSETLTINGTAKASAEFDVEFNTVQTITKVGYTDMDATDADGATEAEKTQATDKRIAVISDDKNTLTITVNKLDYPGAYVEIPVIIKNNSSVPVRLKNIKEENMTSDNGALKVSYSGVATTDAPIPAKTALTAPMVIRVEWLNDDAYKNITSAEITAEKKFSITLEYEQATGTTTSSSAGA